MPLYPHDRLVNGLAAIAEVSPRAERALRALRLNIKAVDAHSDVVREGDHLTQSCLVIEGFLCRHQKMNLDQRQILSFHLPGDLPDLQSLYLETMDYSLGTLTHSVVAFIPHSELRAAMDREEELVDVLWRTTLVDAAIQRAWLGALRRSAEARIAHLFCEIFARMRALGIADEFGFHLPIGQNEIADALGLTAIHVNRTLQELRREGIICSEGKHHKIVDLQRLEKIGGFTPDYLRLRKFT